MIDQDHKQQISDFVSHLLQNPSIGGEPFLTAEGMVLNFIASNIEKLKLTFSSEQFFPDLTFPEVFNLIVHDLYQRACSVILPQLEAHIDSINFSVLESFNKAQVFDAVQTAMKCKEFVRSIFDNKDVRYNLNSVLHIFNMKVIENYITAIFRRRRALLNELIRVQKNNIPCEEYIEYMKILLLIKNSAYIKTAVDENTPDKKVNIQDVCSIKNNVLLYLDVRGKEILGMLPGMTLEMIQMALKSNLNDDRTGKEDASARLLYILTQRFQNYREDIKVDRGAETPDKSWFATARKNASYYGYNKRMLDELYIIAGDNNW